jgi:16S rRNA (guanine(966)-N(2))-methyltransferase RsmD
LSGHPNRIRIIGGVWRSRQISVLSQEGLRPSSDRVRETLFNWLGQDLSGLKVLDAFAGSGALGFESASRDAKEVILIEKDKKIVAQLQSQYQLLLSSPIQGNLKVIQGDGIVHMGQANTATYHLIFLDPPFSQPELLKQAVVEAARICDDHSGGGIYIECPTTQDLLELELLMPNWACSRQMQTTQTKAALFRRTSG